MQQKFHQQAAVLIFARSANEELNHKFIKKGELLFDALTEDTLRKVKRTKLPYFHFTECQQRGNSFGERFANAIEAIFALGFAKIITVGNDSPDLKAKHILKAAEALSHGKNVLGPSTDGGFYLLGLHQSEFDKDSFIKLPWQTPKLFGAVDRQLFEFKGETYKLAFLTDIDSVVDAKQLLNNSKTLSNKLRLLIKAVLIKCDEEIFAFSTLLQDSYLVLTNSVRGSPQ